MHQKELEECIKTCWNTRNVCQQTLFHHCLPIGSVHMEEQHVKHMLDCIQLTQLAADLMTRDSDLHAAICAVCADACEACAKSCEQIGDEKMMECAKACQASAASCRKMGKMRQAA